ncbi:protein salvador homolog 1-like isoform X1 [Bolinopsis microptera]|uniref:protein salvador homolog 1-like isoform X1 n=1 Tax=Bolinopsis microptera TaxID=2820187 RepID=UPI00307A3524
MNKGVLPPNYNDAIKNDVAPTADIRGAGWVLTEPNTDYQQGFPGEFDDTRLGQLRRSGSKSSCSSGSSSNVRFSNGSGMYTMADQNYNLAKELPPGWELRFLSTGRMYYCHLPTDTQHWNHPHEKADLPPGWERVYNNEYGEYFVNHITKTAQFLHPGSLPNPVSGEDHAQALAVMKQRKILQGDSAQFHLRPALPVYLIEEIPIWLQEYAQSASEPVRMGRRVSR